MLHVELLEAGAKAGEGHPVVVHHRLTALDPAHVLVRGRRELVIPKQVSSKEAVFSLRPELPCSWHLFKYSVSRLFSTIAI